MNANQLVLDYVFICERRGEVLSFSEFVDLWLTAQEIAAEEVPGRDEDAPREPVEVFFRYR